MRWMIVVLGLTAACHGPYEDGYEHEFEVSAGATGEQRLAELQAEFEHRGPRLAWTSRSVAKRVGWALEDARTALNASEPEKAEHALDVAERLLTEH